MINTFNVKLYRLLNPLSLLHKHRLELHCADAVDFAVDVVVFIDEAVNTDFGADFGDLGRAFDFEVFDDCDHIACI